MFFSTFSQKIKKKRPFGVSSEEIFQLFHTFSANTLVSEVYHVGGIVTEHAGGLILAKNDSVSVGEDLNRVLFVNIHHLAKLNRKNDASQLVHLSYNTRRFHFITSLAFFVAFGKYSITLPNIDVNP